jgi:hypothetical protein
VTAVQVYVGSGSPSPLRGALDPPEEKPFERNISVTVAATCTKLRRSIGDESTVERPDMDSIGRKRCQIDAIEFSIFDRKLLVNEEDNFF